MSDADKAAARIQTRLDIYNKAIGDDWTEEFALELAGYQNPADLRAVLGDRTRQAERIAELELVPRCGATTPALLGDGTLGPCILDHGHGGMHQEAGRAEFPGVPGASWTERNDALAVAQARIRELEGNLSAVRSWTRSRLKVLDDRRHDYPYSREIAVKTTVLDDLTRVLDHLETIPAPDATVPPDAEDRAT